MTDSIETSGFSIYLKASQFHSRCKICDAQIRIGEPCYWRRIGEKGVACVKCITGKEPPKREIPDGPQGQWHQLIGFLKDSVLVGSTSELISAEELGKYEISDFIQALEDEAKEVKVSGSGVDRAKARLKRKENDPLAIGWPIISFTDALGARKCAPMFVATITVELSQAEEVLLTRESSFALNPALTASDGIGQLIAEQLNEVSENISKEVLAELIPKIAQSLGIPLKGFENSSTPLGDGEEDGIYNSATLIAGESAATATLIRELDELMDRTDWQNTAAASIVTGVMTQLPTPASGIPLVAPLSINHAQEEVLKECGASSITVVTGPPGTGKSQIVVNLIANAWAHNQSILITSTNNAAVDVATSRANSVSPGLVIRTGNKSAREAMPDQFAQLISKSKELLPTERADAESALYTTTKIRDAYYVALAKCAELENIQHERILIEINLEKEIKVVFDVSIPDENVREISQLATKFKKAKFLLKFRWKRFAKKFKLPTDIELIQTSINWLSIRQENIRRREEIINLQVVLGDACENSEKVESDWRNASSTYAERIVSDTIARNKKRFSTIGESRPSYYGTLKAIETVLPFIKGWASTALSMHQNFPFDAGLFDYVIVDEASQCHLAYILPAAYRAKRLIIVGDPNQLAPISKITPEQEIALAGRNRISPADLTRRKLSSSMYSAYDFFANIVGQEKTMLLNEHYRSHPQIARWFNEAFYGSELTLLTDISKFSSGVRPLFWIDINGTAVQPPKGSWINEKEAEAVVDAIQQFLTSKKSLGVVTPFSAQSDLIERIATTRYGQDALAEIDFRVGTAHRFQGDERDVMIFSSVLAPGISNRSAKWVQSNRPLINVAVSRAREQLIVIGNPNINEFECPTLTSLRTFVQTVHEFDENRIGPRIDSEAERNLYEALIEEGLAPISKFNVQGYELDFGLIVGELHLDIEVDGDQHYSTALGNHLVLRKQDIARDKVLIRAGWKVIRIPAWKCSREANDIAHQIQMEISGFSQT